MLLKGPDNIRLQGSNGADIFFQHSPNILGSILAKSIKRNEALILQIWKMTPNDAYWQRVQSRAKSLKQQVSATINRR